MALGRMVDAALGSPLAAVRSSYPPPRVVAPGLSSAEATWRRVKYSASGWGRGFRPNLPEKKERELTLRLSPASRGWCVGLGAAGGGGAVVRGGIAPAVPPRWRHPLRTPRWRQRRLPPVLLLLPLLLLLHVLSLLLLLLQLPLLLLHPLQLLLLRDLGVRQALDEIYLFPHQPDEGPFGNEERR